MINWKQLISKMAYLGPILVAGIEEIHGEKDTATKSQMAADALVLASGASTVIDPSDKATIDAVTQGAALIVSGISQLHAAEPNPAPKPAV